MSEKLLREAIHKYGWDAIETLAAEMKADKSADRTKAAKYLLDLCVVVQKVTEGTDEANANVRVMEIMNRLTGKMSSQDIGLIIEAAVAASEEAKDREDESMTEGGQENERT